MSEGSPWSRLGVVPSEEKEEASVPSNDILIIKDQIAELSKLVMSLISRVEELESGSKEAIDNLLEIVTPEELGLAPLDPVEPVEDDPEVVVVKSGFTAPPPDEMDEIRKLAKSDVEPDGHPTEPAEEVVEEKKFGEEYATALIMADLLAEYISEEGAILNNQVKKRVYGPAELEVTPKDKKLLKTLIEEGHTKFKANKMDNFRTLYYTGDDYAEEYEKSYGKSSD